MRMGANTLSEEIERIAGRINYLPVDLVLLAIEESILLREEESKQKRDRTLLRFG